MQELQVEYRIGDIEACDRFIQHYKTTLQELSPPFLFCGQFCLSPTHFPQFKRLIDCVKSKEDEWLQREYEARLSELPGASQLGSEEIEALERYIDSLAARSEEILIWKKEWYTNLFEELHPKIFPLISLLREYRPCTPSQRRRKISEPHAISRGDVYETLKTSLRAASILPNSSSSLTETEQAIHDIAFQIVSTAEYFTDSVTLKSHFTNYICPFLLLMNVSLPIYFPARVKALLKEYNAMRPFLV